MRRSVLGFCAAVVIGLGAIPATASASSPNLTFRVKPETEDSRLYRLFAQIAEREDALDPLANLYRGEPVEADAFALLFTDELQRAQRNAAREALAGLSAIDRANLSDAARISYDVIVRAKQRQLDWRAPDMRDLMQVRPFNHFGGIHVEFPGLMSHGGIVPYRTEDDYRRALALYRAFPRVLDTAIARFRQGLATDVTEPKVTVTNMIGQIDALLANGVEGSPFYTPALAFPEAMPAATQRRLRADMARAIHEDLNPAYARLRAFLAKEYLPAARERPGLFAMNGGDTVYRRLIEEETTLPLDPAAIHAEGLREVARIRREMEAVKAQLGYAGPLGEFFVHIRTDPRFHPTSAQELADGFAAIRKDVLSKLPRFFAHMPRTPLQIQPYAPYRERYEAGGGYLQGTPDGSRPGVFQYNTYDLPARYLSSMATLYLHEAEPGHHFQISLAQENETLPDFQRFGGNNAYVEGWALYAETLGYAMGLYDDPLQHWGTLDDEMLRAMRLVVDTGIHARGWSRDQAIAYMLANSGMGRTDAVAEVDRYIANPAQALSYKIGAMTIQRLRRKAEAALGDRFDIRAFHDAVLGSGALPLPILEDKIDRWIAAQR